MTSSLNVLLSVLLPKRSAVDALTTAPLTIIAEPERDKMLGPRRKSATPQHRYGTDLAKL